MRIGRIAAVSLVSILLAHVALADVSVPPLFGDHMVLQQGRAVPFWGTAEPGEEITVKAGDRQASAKADEHGQWQVRLEPISAEKPIKVTIAGKNTITLKDVLVGEVWVCSGQSNMQWPVRASDDPEKEIAAANHPEIRLFTVPRKVSGSPQTTVEGSWQRCTPETVGDFSAVAYFFGRSLQQAVKTPVGLIHTSWGGTPAESWTTMSTLQADPDFKPILERWEELFKGYSAQIKQYVKKLNLWQEQMVQTDAEGQSPPAPPALPAHPRQNPHRPSGLYNAMIHPLVPYAVAGAIWYQGESNAKRAYQYRKLFPAMISDWRRVWDQGDFPFLFVQLANYQASQKEPYASTWAELREAQTMTLALPKTGMAVTIDIGNPKDIHPRNKQEVGRRLALAAQAIGYGRNVSYFGPMYESMAVEGDSIRLKFKDANAGLEAKDGELKGFGIAGEDRQFVDAKAHIDGQTVVVSSPRVTKPVAVRYGWADSPECNLYNTDDLPASPFRTDDWPGVTVNEK